MRIAISGSVEHADGENLRSKLDPPTAGVTLVSSDSDEVTLWILKIFDGDPSDRGTKSLHEYYREVHPPQCAEECLVEAEEILRSFYGLSAWVKDSSPVAGFQRSWKRIAC
jgi:hypothetical protein